MASGKSAVGAELSRRLGWERVDLDEEIVRRAGRPIAEIFRSEGEAAFRRLEAEVTRELLPRAHTIFSPGGGWITNPEMISLIPPGTLTVWLQVTPETVLERVRADATGPERPLLGTSDPEATARRLLQAREPLYRQARHAIVTDGRSVAEIAAEIEGLVRAARQPNEPESHSPTQDA